MYRIKWLSLLLVCGLCLSACGESEQKTEALIYQSTEKDTEKQEYETTTVTRGTYEEKISSTTKFYYPNDKTVTISDSRAYVDKICVKEGQKVKKGDALIVYHLKISDTTMEKKKLEVEQAQNDYDVKLKGKRNDVLQKQREIKNILDAAEKKIAQLQLKKLQREYKEIVAEGKSVKKKQKEYDELVQKRKSATLRSKYAGTAVDIKATVGMSASEDTLMTIRDKKDFLIEAVDADGSTMRYNMTVDVRLGVTSDKIKHHIKGKVISTDNLESSGDGDMEEGSTGSQLIRISKKDRYKYDFDKYNVYVTATSLKIEDALLVEEDAVNEESEGENGTKYFVYVVENDKLHKRYIVSNYHQDGGCYLVNQGLEEGQTLAILSKN